MKKYNSIIADGYAASKRNSSQQAISKKHLEEHYAGVLSQLRVNKMRNVDSIDPSMSNKMKHIPHVFNLDVNSEKKKIKAVTVLA